MRHRFLQFLGLDGLGCSHHGKFPKWKVNMFWDSPGIFLAAREKHAKILPSREWVHILPIGKAGTSSTQKCLRGRGGYVILPMPSVTPYILQWATGVRTPMIGVTTLLINWCFLSHLPSFHRMCVTDTTSPPKNHRRRLRFPVLRGCNKLKAKGRFESSRLKAVLSPSHFCEEILFVPWVQRLNEFNHWWSFISEILNFMVCYDPKKKLGRISSPI